VEVTVIEEHGMPYMASVTFLSAEGCEGLGVASGTRDSTSPQSQIKPLMHRSTSVGRPCAVRVVPLPNDEVVVELDLDRRVAREVALDLHGAIDLRQGASERLARSAS